MRLNLTVLIFVLMIAGCYEGKAADTTKFYIMPHLKFVPKTGQTAVTLGGDVAYSPLNRFFIGLSYQRVVNNFMPLTETDIRKELKSSWGGIKFDYVLKNQEVYMLYANLETGVGLLDIIIREPGALPEENEWYNYIQLGCNFDMTLSDKISLSMGLHYRFLSEINYKNVESVDIGGMSGQLGVRYLFFK